MKKLLFASISILFIISCNKKKDNNNMHLTGNIKGLQYGKLYIQKMVDTNLVVVETINIDGDSHFETNIKIKEPEMYFLYLDRGVTNSLDNRLQFFAEPGEINIETSLENYSYNAIITGTKNNELYADHRKIISRFNNESLSITEQRFAAIKDKNISKIDSLDKRREAIIKKTYLYTINFALNNKEYEISPFITVSEIFDVNLKYLDTIKKSMSPKVANSLYGKKLTALYNERLRSEQ